MQKIRWWDSWPSFISPGSGNMGWWDLTINDSLMAHFKFLYLLAYFVSVFAFRRWRGWQDQKSCHGFLSISFKLYISELHLDDVYEDFDRTRWNDRNGCFESQTKGVGGRDNNSIVIIITIVIIMIVIMIIFFTIIIIKDLRLRAVEITATGCCESHFPPFPLKPWNVILQSLLITEVIISRLLR